MTSPPAAPAARGGRTATAAPGTPTPCCTGTGLKRGPWTPEEDEVLAGFIRREGEGKWRTLPRRAGLLRCGKSCRLRWMNYLKPSVKRGRITPDEEDLILRLHRLLGNRWSLIAGRIPGRTDNEIKNYWNTHLSKKLISNGIDPTTHRPLNPKHRLCYRTANPNPSSEDPNCTPEPHRKTVEEPVMDDTAAAEESGGHAGTAAVPPMVGPVEEASRLGFLPEEQYYFSSLLDSFVVDGDELLRGMGDGYCRSYYASSSDGLGEYESIGSLWDVAESGSTSDTHSLDLWQHLCQQEKTSIL